jgi:LemA protein
VRAGIYLIILILIAGLVWLVVTYNKLVAMRRMVANAWSDMDVFLKRRADLVPNLVEAVKGASAYEQGTLERIVQARSDSISNQGPTAEKAAAESQLGSGIVRAVALAESYPVLQANANFLNLQKQLSEVEGKIADSRQYYNACVRDYNTMIESFPSSIIAGSMGFKEQNSFEIEDLTERLSPGVKGL